jgi:carboxyl-terminal processing protease
MSLRPITLFGIVLSMVTGIALGISGYHAWLKPSDPSADARDFGKVLTQVRESYVSEIDERELVRGALKGMLSELDPHSRYVDGGDLDALEADTTGEFSGIGIEIGLLDDHFVVISPMPNSPAKSAGLSAGDRILELDNISLRGKRLIDVVELLRGEAGSDVHMRVSNDQQTRDITLTRAIIELASVEEQMLEPGYGYIRISQFHNTTGRDFLSALKKLTVENESGLEGLVLDLRDNPGGVLQASVSVADAFLEDGLIVYTSGRLPSSHLKYRASGKDTLAGKPIVILINGGSASAAEIVAGALKDHSRATLIGATSYGKGSVQSVMPLDGHRAIKLTTAYYYTPNGASIHNKGIEPDVRVNGVNLEDSSAANEELMATALEVLKSQNMERADDESTSLQARL